MREALGVARCEIEGPELSKRLPETGKLDAVLDLVGNSVIVDCLSMLPLAGAPALRVGWAALRLCRTSTPWRS